MDRSRQPRRLFKTDFYTKGVLTVIAFCLVLLCLSAGGVNWGGALRAGLGLQLGAEFLPEPTPVHLVAIGRVRGQLERRLPWREVPVDIGMPTLDVNVTNRNVPVYIQNAELDVNVPNTIDVKVKNTVDVYVENTPLEVEAR